MNLEKYYTAKGYGPPKYSFVHFMDEKGHKMICAELILPNGITIRGDPKRSQAEV